MFINGVPSTVRTKLSRFKEEHNRVEIIVTRPKKEAQDIGNTLRLQMAQFYERPARSASGVTAKVAQNIRLTRTSPSSCQVHLVEQNARNAEGLFVVNEESVKNSEDYIDTEQLPSTARTTPRTIRNILWLCVTVTVNNYGCWTPNNCTREEPYQPSRVANQTEWTTYHLPWLLRYGWPHLTGI